MSINFCVLSITVAPKYTYNTNTIIGLVEVVTPAVV